MSKRRPNGVRQTFLLGLLSILPLALTIAVVVWIIEIIAKFLGPQSEFGSLVTSFGGSIGAATGIAYAIGILLTLSFIYLLGILMRVGLRERFRGGLTRILKRIPLIGGIYDLSTRVIGLMEPGDDPDLKSMAPVWCTFGGDDGTTVLAFQTDPTPVVIEGNAFVSIMVPSSPVPMGGALLFVPVDWVKPADVGVEGMVSIYVSMGTTVGTHLPRPVMVNPGKTGALGEQASD